MQLDLSSRELLAIRWAIATSTTIETIDVEAMGAEDTDPDALRQRASMFETLARFCTRVGYSSLAMECLALSEKLESLWGPVPRC